MYRIIRFRLLDPEVTHVAARLCAAFRGGGQRRVTSGSEREKRSGAARPLTARSKLTNTGERRVNIMNPVYSPAPTGVPYVNPKGIGYPAGFPVGYAAAAPAYSPNVYPGANPAFPTGYAPGTPFKMSCSPTTGAVPPYSSSPNPYPAAVYPVRSSYPQQNPYAQQQGTYYTQPLRHGNGSRHHYGNVRWDFINNSLPNSSSSPPSHSAHISSPWNTHLQLRAPSVVNRWHCQRMVDMHSHSPVFYSYSWG
ncbi:hypothetical protein MHYP_G00024130 [Metynnis hypsauchen]